MEKIKNKKGLELVTSCFLGYKTNSEKWCNIKQVLSYSKNYIC